MWSHKQDAALRRAVRVAVIVGLASLAAGCFRPLYGEYAVTNTASLRGALAAVDVVPVEAPAATPLARIAVELRNALTFELNGGAGPAAPTHRLVMRLASGTNSIIVDPTTGRPEYDIVVLDATYQLIEIASGRPVLDGVASARTSYDIPGQQQRFNILRGQRDAQSRAALVIVEQIRSRLASYFVAGT